MKKIPLIIVAGPTASGKTQLSIELAKQLDGEIISCDSMQIYKYMDIGTAKPTEAEKCGIVHHLMDFKDPAENFSVAEYCECAKPIIEDIYSRKKLPIIVGGTGLYMDSLAQSVDFGENDKNEELTARFLALAETDGNEKVWEMLNQVDPGTAQKYHPNNIRRIVRALEFYYSTGMTISEYAKLPKESPYHTIYFCIDWDREILYKRIDQRVDRMLSQGLLDEVKSLLDKGYKKDLTSMQAIGYKEFFDYFDGAQSLEDAVMQVKQNSRRYAKRQLTWFRRNKNMHHLQYGPGMVDDALSIIKAELLKLK